ncbi:MAG TPA: class I SAM-dependent methyltransferase [Candidatus Dormibacteraeota bacterium]|nr:class I SAM-dependent methyltransferase [Candidatus Dormibacteraeota bacterium]
MRYEEFLERLPALFDGWGTAGARPTDGRFAALAAALPCFSAAGTLQVLNLAVALLDPGEVYCEAGVYRGCTLVGALTGNDGARALALEDFSQFDGGRAGLERNLERFGVRDRVELAGVPFERHFLERGPEPPAGVYFYDAAHDYRSQLLGLLLAVPFLAERALIVVDDANWAAPRQAVADFCACRPEARLALALPTPAVDHPTFWNGLQVLTWERTADRAGRHGRLVAQSEPGFVDHLHAAGFQYERRAGRIPAGHLPTDS